MTPFVLVSLENLCLFSTVMRVGPFHPACLFSEQADPDSQKGRQKFVFGAMRPISCSLLPHFLFSNNPVNDLLVIKKDFPTAMVVVNPLAVKIGIVGDFQP